MKVSIRQFPHTILAFGIVMLATLVIASPALSADVWNTPEGKVCFEKWAGAIADQLNGRKGHPQFESGKPYSITKFGAVRFKGMAQPDKAPEGWTKKFSKNRDKFLWQPDGTDFNANASYIVFSGQIFPGLGVRGYVRRCLSLNGITIADNGTQTGGAPTPATTPAAIPNTPKVTPPAAPPAKTVIAPTPVKPEQPKPAATGKMAKKVSPAKPAMEKKPGTAEKPGKTAGDGLQISGFYSFLTRRPNATLCKAACEAHAECRSWTYVSPGTLNHQTSGTCWLKRGIPVTPPALCCTSGVSK